MMRTKTGSVTSSLASPSRAEANREIPAAKSTPPGPRMRAASSRARARSEASVRW